MSCRAEILKRSRQTECESEQIRAGGYLVVQRLSLLILPGGGLGQKFLHGPQKRAYGVNIGLLPLGWTHTVAEKSFDQAGKIVAGGLIYKHPLLALLIATIHGLKQTSDVAQTNESKLGLCDRVQPFVALHTIANITIAITAATSGYL